MQRFLHARDRASGGSNRRAGLAAIALAGSVLVAAGCASSSSTSSTASSPPFSPDSKLLLRRAALLGGLRQVLAAGIGLGGRVRGVRRRLPGRGLAVGGGRLVRGVRLGPAGRFYRAEAQSVLAKTEGTGNALSDITLTGLPKAQTAGLNAALVTVVNSTSSTASYAIKVEFLDGDQVVDTTVLGITDVAPGAKATATAFSSLDRDKALVPRVAQAQRY